MTYWLSVFHETNRIRAQARAAELPISVEEAHELARRVVDRTEAGDLLAASELPAGLRVDATVNALKEFNDGVLDALT